MHQNNLKGDCPIMKKLNDLIWEDESITLEDFNASSSVPFIDCDDSTVVFAGCVVVSTTCLPSTTTCVAIFSQACGGAPDPFLPPMLPMIYDCGEILSGCGDYGFTSVGPGKKDFCVL